MKLKLKDYLLCIFWAAVTGFVTGCLGQALTESLGIACSRPSVGACIGGGMSFSAALPIYIDWKRRSNLIKEIRLRAKVAKVIMK